MAGSQGVRKLPDDIRKSIYQELLARSTIIILPDGDLMNTAAMLSMSCWTFD